MSDYIDLAKRLRTCVELSGECALCLYQGNGCDAMPETPMAQAADAIEDLERELMDLKMKTCGFGEAKMEGEK